jgi:hypothetical protein
VWPNSSVAVIASLTTSTDCTIGMNQPVAGSGMRASGSKPMNMPSDTATIANAVRCDMALAG